MATGTQRAATLHDKPMDDEQREILRKCREVLVRGMDPVQVLQQIVEPNPFSADEENEIMANTLTRQQRCEILLDILPRKGAGAYTIFKETIKKVHRPLLGTILEAENEVLRSEVTLERDTADPRRRLQHSEVKQGTPTDDELEKLGFDIGDIWMRLGRRLDVSDAKLKEIDRAIELLSEKAYYSLKHWKQSKGAAANYQALCDALQDECVQRQDLVEKYCYIKDVPKLAPRRLPTPVKEAALGLPKTANDNQLKGMKFDHVYTASYIQVDAPKTIIFTETVKGEAFSRFSEEIGVKINISPKTMPEPRIIVCSSWCPDAVSLPLEDDETLVSSVIELECDDPVDINFTGITVALWHSAAESRQYELVMKELVNREKNTWKDLETAPEPLDENCKIRFVKASITSFSLYAVICRLKSYTFSCNALVKSSEFTCQVSEYPGMSVTIPRKSMYEDMKVKIKVQDVPNDDFEKTQVLVGPILHIDSSMKGELEEPASITMPIALEQDQEKVQNVETSHVRLGSRSKSDGSQDWVDITNTLQRPPKIEGGVLTFQVKSTDSSFGVVTNKSGEELNIQDLLNQDCRAKHFVAFEACLCDIGRRSVQQLIVCCYPFHSRNTLRKDMSSQYRVVCHGEEVSGEPLKRREKVAFTLSDALIPAEGSGNELTFLRFLEEGSFKTSFPVLVAKPEAIPQILFFTDEKTLCSLYVFPVSQPQKNPEEFSKDKTDAAYLVELCEKRTDPFTAYHVLQIKDAVGQCWEDLGVALGIDQAKLQNLNHDYRKNRERANKVLQTWMEKDGTDATVGCLACNLIQIGHKRIADILLGHHTEQSKKPSERPGEQSKQPSEREGEQSTQPSENESADDVFSLLAEIKRLTKIAIEREHNETLKMLIEDMKQLDTQIQDLENIIKPERK